VLDVELGRLTICQCLKDNRCEHGTPILGLTATVLISHHFFVITSYRLATVARIDLKGHSESMIFVSSEWQYATFY